MSKTATVKQTSDGILGIEFKDAAGNLLGRQSSCTIGSVSYTDVTFLRDGACGTYEMSVMIYWKESDCGKSIDRFTTVEVLNYNTADEYAPAYSTDNRICLINYSLKFDPNRILLVGTNGDIREHAYGGRKVFQNIGFYFRILNTNPLTAMNFSLSTVTINRSVAQPAT